MQQGRIPVDAATRGRLRQWWTETRSRAHAINHLVNSPPFTREARAYSVKRQSGLTAMERMLEPLGAELVFSTPRNRPPAALWIYPWPGELGAGSVTVEETEEEQQQPWLGLRYISAGRLAENFWLHEHDLGTEASFHALARFWQRHPTACPMRALNEMYWSFFSASARQLRKAHDIPLLASGGVFLANTMILTPHDTMDLGIKHGGYVLGFRARTYVDAGLLTDAQLAEAQALRATRMSDMNGLRFALPPAFRQETVLYDEEDTCRFAIVPLRHIVESYARMIADYTAEQAAPDDQEAA